ncbi:alpha-1,2-mannosyltransferase ALG9-like [Planococcus citri]|uniref:alpha-1,2-mannosyltransferase ALG9-like n=1 Tax=Planococcus citri TaxID=170843 RepID=UPI0031F942C9
MPPRNRTLSKQQRSGKQSKDKKEKKVPDEATLRKNYGNSGTEEPAVFYLTPTVAFKAIFCFRIISAIWLHISDPDETFNYWEPSHNLLFNYGFQTWEYTPEYALKSYFYLLIHAVPAWIYYELFHPTRVLLFYFIRCFLAAICTFSELLFYKGVCREFGIHIGRMTLIILIFSPGMFVAGTAFLPSSFCMYITFLIMASWFYKKRALAVFLSFVSVFISWSFSLLVGLPIGYEMVVLKKKRQTFLNYFLLSFLTALVPVLDTDSAYYGKLTFVSWNVLKHSFSNSANPDPFYKPWYFYLVNGFLNFNVCFVLALFTPYLVIWIQKILPKKPRNEDSYPYKLSLGVLYLWLLIFAARTAKKEQFLFPVYPLIALNAAVSIDALQVLWFKYFIKKGYHYTRSTIKLAFMIILCYCVLGLSRMMASYKASHATMDIFIQLSNVNKNLTGKTNVNLCIEKEWERFPSSYFLPDKWKMNFIKPPFNNEIPGYYVEDEAQMAKFIGKEKSIYVDIDHCDYLIDSDNKAASKNEFLYSSHRNWTAIYSSKYLDERSPWLSRSFYIPTIWESKCNFVPFHLLKRNRFPRKKSK